jgi:hypothetical protein
MERACAAHLRAQGLDLDYATGTLDLETSKC